MKRSKGERKGDSKKAKKISTGSEKDEGSVVEEEQNNEKGELTSERTSDESNISASKEATCEKTNVTVTDSAHEISGKVNVDTSDVDRLQDVIQGKEKVITGMEEQDQESDKLKDYREQSQTTELSTEVNNVSDGVSYSSDYKHARYTLDGLPAHNDPRLPSTDGIRHLRHKSLLISYVGLALLPTVQGFVQYGKTTSTNPYRGISFDNFIGTATEDTVEFIVKSIEFKSIRSDAINLSRANPYCPELHFMPIPGNYLNRDNKVLHYGDKPILCITPIIAVHSNLMDGRIISSIQDYIVKDVQAQVLMYEWERLCAFLALVYGINLLYISGIVIGEPLITFSTNFTKLSTQRERAKAKNTKIHAEEYNLSAEDKKEPERVQAVSNTVFLYPTDDVPIYDLSGNEFDFDTHLDINVMEKEFRRLYADPPPNSRCLVAYYPSIWIRDGKPVVRFNIKWLGVIDS